MAKRKIYLWLVLGICLLLVTTALAAPQTFSLARWSTAGGGGTSTGGPYRLSGNVGQPDAGVLSAGDTVLVGGFRSGVVAARLTRSLYLPLMLR